MTETRPGQETIGDLLGRVVRDTPGERIALGQLIDALDERAYGLLLLVLALPMALPLSAIPGVSTVFGVPLCIVAAQLMLGRPRPVLPRVLARKSFARADLGHCIERATPWLERAQRMVHPRWLALTGPSAERAIGAVCLFLGIIMALPIIGGNQPPGIAISLYAIALLERDGLFVLLGLFGTVAALAIVSAVIGAFGAAAYLLFIHLFG